MIAHVILFEPRQDLTEVERHEVLAAFRRAAETAPTVRAVRIGRRVRHGLPGYESAMRDGFEYLAVLEFDDLDGLKSYLTRPEHADAGRHFTTSAAQAIAYDYLLEAGNEESLTERK